MKKVQTKREPLYSLTEIAEMLGVSLGLLRGNMRLDPDRPQPRLKFDSTHSRNRKWYYAKSEVTNWWKGKKKERNP
jgi:hypothetical protein